MDPIYHGRSVLVTTRVKFNVIETQMNVTFIDDLVTSGTTPWYTGITMDKVIRGLSEWDIDHIIEDLRFLERAKAAAVKAGWSQRDVASFEIKPYTDVFSYADEVGVEVSASDETTRQRLTAWVSKALEASGMRMVTTGGSWGRPPRETGPLKIDPVAGRVVCCHHIVSELAPRDERKTHDEHERRRGETRCGGLDSHRSGVC